MTFLVDRLVELRRHLDHLTAIGSRVPDPEALRRDMSLYNDTMFSLLMVSQLVVDIAGELSSRNGQRFDDYTSAVRNLRGTPGLDDGVIAVLERLPGFRNVVIHEYVALDLDMVVAGLRNLDPVRQFLKVVARSETAD